MYLDSAKKQELFEKYGKSATNTGSAESQIALFTFRISHLTEHLKANHKDYATERSLKMLVGKRRRLLDYLIKTDIPRYHQRTWYQKVRKSLLENIKKGNPKWVLPFLFVLILDIIKY